MVPITTLKEKPMNPIDKDTAVPKADGEMTDDLPSTLAATDSSSTTWLNTNSCSSKSCRSATKSSGETLTPVPGGPSASAAPAVVTTSRICCVLPPL